MFHKNPNSSKKSLPFIHQDRENEKKRKNEQNYIPLQSEHDFFEIFMMKTKHCINLKIPCLLYFEENSQKILLGNQIEKSNFIVKPKKIETVGFFLKLIKNKNKFDLEKKAKNVHLKFAEKIYEGLKKFSEVKKINFLLESFK